MRDSRNLIRIVRALNPELFQLIDLSLIFFHILLSWVLWMQGTEMWTTFKKNNKAHFKDTHALEQRTKNQGYPTGQQPLPLAPKAFLHFSLTHRPGQSGSLVHNLKVLSHSWSVWLALQTTTLWLDRESYGQGQLALAFASNPLCAYPCERKAWASFLEWARNRGRWKWHHG